MSVVANTPRPLSSKPQDQTFHRERFDPAAGLASIDWQELHRLDVLGTRAFLPPALRIGHLLTLVQIVKAHALDAGRMEEEVFAASRVDESKTPVRQSFDSAFSHFLIPLVIV
jgi:hypothetical protein